MATISISILPPPRGNTPGQLGLLHEIRQFWQQFIVAAFNPYRPEQHYMRGPGPACRAKETAAPPHIELIAARIAGRGACTPRRVRAMSSTPRTATFAPSSPHRMD